MTIFVPEMLATSSTDGFLHSNLQNGAPRITPPTAPMLNCWIQSQKGSLFQIFSTTSFPSARVPAWPPLPGKKSAEQRRKERKSRVEWEGPRAPTGGGWSVIHKQQDHTNNGSQLFTWTVFIFPFKCKFLNTVPKFHLLSKAGYLGQVMSFLLDLRTEGGTRRITRVVPKLPFCTYSIAQWTKTKPPSSPRRRRKQPPLNKGAGTSTSALPANYDVLFSPSVPLQFLPNGLERQIKHKSSLKETLIMKPIQLKHCLWQSPYPFPVSESAQGVGSGNGSLPLRSVGWPPSKPEGLPHKREQANRLFFRLGRCFSSYIMQRAEDGNVFRVPARSKVGVAQEACTLTEQTQVLTSLGLPADRSPTFKYLLI